MKIPPLILILSLTGLLCVDAADRDFTPQTVIDRSFPPIIEPKMLSVSKAEKADTVSDDELVLGVVVNGTARAYPINTLTGPQREIINDELGGRSIAATW